jgi:hypothetical protein
MDQSNQSDIVQQFVQKYAFRYVEKDRRFLGLFQGLCIDIWQRDGSIYLYFFSSSAKVADAAVEGFKSFTHVTQSGVPPEWLTFHGVGALVLAAPFAASIYFCIAVGRAAQGMNLWLSVLTTACIMLSIIAANIWGLQTAILRQQEISWPEAVKVYFTWGLTHAESNEWWYLLGGLAGTWLGFGLLKRQRVVKYR